MPTALLLIANRTIRTGFILSALALFPVPLLSQTLRGMVTDSESRQPLPGVNVICRSCNPPSGGATDSSGIFNLSLPSGRHTIDLSCVGYASKQLTNIYVVASKEQFLIIDLEEQVFETTEIAVRGNANRWINSMATVSVRSLRSQDAVRYAGGYFDVSRMVANFAGVATGTNDENNEIVIRGNSPRGLLWRLEGVEIPNPNHFANGQGATGGGFSSITTNVLSSFDFFTGSFPSEFGNALSGVMDLSLRQGNTERCENGLMLSVLGVEASTEGPIIKGKNHSFVANFRSANFRYLVDLGIMDSEEFGVVPKTHDWASKVSLKTTHAGSFDLFTVGGSSTSGDVASAPSGDGFSDSDEYLNKQSIAIAGIKHALALPNLKTYVRTTIAFTQQKSTDQSGRIDQNNNSMVTYYDRFEYPAFRLSSMLNHKFNARHSLRIGTNLNFLSADMYAHRLNNQSKNDTLVDQKANGYYGSYYLQWKHKPNDAIETNTGLHVFHQTISDEWLFEPRWGAVLKLADQQSLRIGTGVHSRLEPLAIYYYRNRISGSIREPRNSELKTTKAFHVTLGYQKNLNQFLQFWIEAYLQNLWDVPVSKTRKGQYSILNSSAGLPDVLLANYGKAKNKGIEATIEGLFPKSSFALFTFSLFDSKYQAPNTVWYNTYYNTNYVCNLVGGKEYHFGSAVQQTLGFKLRGMTRGGFRYTPVNDRASHSAKRLVYNNAETYGERLPPYLRFDVGMSYRIGKHRKALVAMIDIQNILNRRNVLRRRFQYRNDELSFTDSKSIGLIPIFSIKAEF